MNMFDFSADNRQDGYVYYINGYTCVMVPSSPTTVDIGLFVYGFNGDIVGSMVWDKTNNSASRNELAQLLQPVPLGDIRERIVDNLTKCANEIDFA